MYLPHFGQITDLVKLSEDLLRHISALTQAALFVHTLNLDHNVRHTRIKEAMQAYLLMQVRMFGCTLSDAKITEIFETDIELNTQGLGVWLDGLPK